MIINLQLKADYETTHNTLTMKNMLTIKQIFQA